MNVIQKFFVTIFPRAWAEEMEAESRTWMIRCTCGYEKSVWDSGGIRWKARGNPRRFRRCSNCGQSTWHTVYRKQ
jgi:hypothetical protein